MKLVLLALFCVAVVLADPEVDDATRSKCASTWKYGFKYSYEHSRCYCPWQRKKMTFTGDWMCYWKETGQSKALTNAWDMELPRSVSSRHCLGDREGYVYYAEHKTCECPQAKKKFFEANSDGKAKWLCVMSTSNVMDLLPHEHVKPTSEVTTSDCFSSRLVFDARASQPTCRCAQEHIVRGAVGSGVDNKLYCDLGTTNSRRVFKGLMKIHTFETLENVAANNKGRYALLSDNPKADFLDLDDGYDSSLLNRRTNEKLLVKEGSILVVKNNVASDGDVDHITDADKALCQEEYGFRFDYSEQRCYCPESLKRMTYEGDWLCTYNDKTAALTNAWDKPPSRPSTKHCLGDRDGHYVYRKASKTCECPEKSKKFLDSNSDGKARWACILSNSEAVMLHQYEYRKPTAEVTTANCVSKRLIMKKLGANQVTCRCRTENIIFGGAGTGLENGKWCDLGAQRTRAVWEGVQKLTGYVTLAGVTPANMEGTPRFAELSDNPRLDAFDTDDGYTAADLRRRRSSKYFVKKDGVLVVKTPPRTTDTVDEETDSLTPQFDDATVANCRSQMQAGWKWSFEHSRCYCPNSRKKMLYNGDWICFYKATGKSAPLTSAWDLKLPSRVTTAHCHGDLNYVYVASRKQCECAESKKKFVEANKDGKAKWVCAHNADKMTYLQAHEKVKDLADITSRHCFSSRLQLKRDAAQVTCRCKTKDLVFGGFGTSLEDKIHCDLGTKSQRRAFEAYRKLANYDTLQGDFTSTSGAGRYAVLDTNPKADFLDSDDGYTPAWLRRKRTSRYLKKNEDGQLHVVSP